MATNFPTSLDSYTDVADGDTIQISTTNNMQDAIEALETKVGIDSSAETSSHDYKIGAIETILGSASTADLTKLHGVTATADELNIMDGVTATTSELNIMDGVTATTAELNKLDGVTGSTAEINAAVDAIKAATTTGDLLVKGSASIERLAAVAATQYLKSAGTSTKPAYSKLSLADTGVKIGYGTRDSSAASGNETVSGVGFEPSAIIFIAFEIGNSDCHSLGFDDGSTHLSMYFYQGYREIGSDKAIFLRESDAIYMSGYVSSTSSDGFTIAWYKTANNLTHNLKYIYLALP